MTASPAEENSDDVLLHLRVRPGLYLGKKSVERLDLFVGGICCAERLHQIPPGRTLLRMDLRTFHAWIEKVHNPLQLSLSSFGLAAREAGSDELGFDKWFEWYDEWQSRRD